MRCVKCSGELRRVEIDEVVVDQCDACDGIWFDSGELERVLGMKSVSALHSPARPSRADDEKRARCPRCPSEGLLVPVASMTSDIHVDTCPLCGGKWLDGGELAVLRDEGGIRPVLALFRRLLSA
jgi:hypothetical protein